MIEDTVVEYCYACSKSFPSELRTSIFTKDQYTEKCLVYKMHKITGKEYIMHPEGGFICLECHGILIKILELEEEFINTTITNRMDMQTQQQNALETVSEMIDGKPDIVTCQVDENYFGSSNSENNNSVKTDNVITTEFEALEFSIKEEIEEDEEKSIEIKVLNSAEVLAMQNDQISNTHKNCPITTLLVLTDKIP